ncbi:MAG: RagB/SusD family nutrient uptake outer membrane protein [Chitinophagaceae bacterium]|nr:RagB/SusD family nutrient uptake outer membrane protein [Sphingobacteriales bacterium]OJW00049.1 MAG: RagB/SusD family nutrient uptake outer membrane protein [Sphingobacteriales bacterium 44-61]TXJ27495.1 MAG: RagB/SusD family nutrient uptake outer membrane protein [Chitinophagaceae bacterium]
MKQFIRLTIAISVMACIMPSCKKDLLNVDNPNTITEEQFWKTEADAEKGINAAYAMFYKPGGWARWIYFRLDLTSDEGCSKSPWIELADWTRFQYVNYNFWEGNAITWRDTYKAVFRCNQVLANVPDIPFTDNSKKDLILAQAKFLRGLHYYYAAIMWENIPLVLEPSKPDDLPQQYPLAEVWTQVEKDFTEALAVLPVQWDDGNVGRPTKGAANAFLARTFMQQHKWQQAKTALDYFFTGAGSGKYDLMPNFQDNFVHTSENNKESVFEIQFSDVNKGGDGDDPNQNMGSHRAQFFAPRGIGWSDGQARYWLVNEFKKEKTASNSLDPRLRYSLFYPALQADFGDKVYGRNWEWNNDEAWFRKYQRDYFRTNEDYFSQDNFRMVRFSDVLLMYAETLNELDQTITAAKYVDSVRARVNMTPLAMAHPDALLSKDAFRERLKTERVLELCGESVRWADLKRWGDLETQTKVNLVAQRDPDFNNFVVGKHIRLPIPQTEVLNNPNLDQNDKY